VIALDRLRRVLGEHDLLDTPVSARCPAHDDGTASLSLGERRDGHGAVICCHAGCTAEDVLDVLGLAWSDLYDDDAPKPWTTDGLRGTGAQTRDDGRVQMGGVAYLPGGVSREKARAVKGQPRELWPAPEDVAGPTLYVVEGEPDAQTAHELGLPAVGIPGAKKWQPEWRDRLAAGRERIVIVADSDEPGRAAAERWAGSLAEVVADVRVLDLSPSSTDGYDLSAFAADAAGDDERRQAAELIRTAAASAPSAGVPANGDPGVRSVGTPTEGPMNTGVLGVPTSGTPGTSVGRPKLRMLDVAMMAATEPPPVPWVVQPLLARSCVTMLAGREGTGKSMLALALAAAIGHGASIAGLDCQPGRVLYVDAENGEREAHRRIRGLGVPPHGLVYLEADAFSLRADVGLLDAAITEHKPTVVVLDSLRSLAPGLDENDSGAAEGVLRPVVRLAQTREVAVLVLHHASRASGEYRGSTAIGAAVELGFTLARNPEDPEARTRRRLACWKSRPAAEPEPHWLTLAAEDGRITLSEAEPFNARAGARDDAEDRLLAVLNGQPMTWADWARAASMEPTDGTPRRARDQLLAGGLVEQTPAGLWTRASS